MSLRNLIKNLLRPYPMALYIYRMLRAQYKFARKSDMQTPWGFTIAGNAEMANGEFEKQETNLIRKLLLDVEVLVNIGANIGYYCCHALSMGKSVIAFEPMQNNMMYLLHNIKKNGWSEAEIYPIAVSDKVGIFDMFGESTGASLIKGWANVPEDFKQLVPASTLDILLGERLCGRKTLILIDIEGAENLMLAGAKQILKNEPMPIWFLEVLTTEHQPQGIAINPSFSKTFEFFFQNNYRAFVADDTMREIFPHDVELLQSGQMILSTHNYIFQSISVER